MTIYWQRLAVAILIGSSATVSFAATPDVVPPQDAKADVAASQIWRVDGGNMRVRLNDSFLDLFDIDIAYSAAVRDKQQPDFAIFPILPDGGLSFNAPDTSFERFVDGRLLVRGGFELILADGSRLDIRDAELRPNVDNPVVLDVVGADGQVWMYVNHLMYTISQEYRAFNVRTADLRATAALAERVGEPALADAYLGELNMTNRIVARSRDVVARPKGNVPDFHGTAHPSGGVYEADVLMESYSMSFMRCRRSNQSTNGCDGAGSDDGEVVFAPSATLRNTNGTHSADVPWYEKFTTSPYSYPYPGNDQHPYLIWNAFRIVDDQLEQIGYSGVKHAFLTINVGCAPGAFTGNGHILGKNCSDTYGTGNNDNISDLGPRREILPASGQFGRCGSVFDTNCDGSENSNGSCSGAGNGCYNNRLVLRESQMLVPGATFMTEAWYVVLSDIDIYNTMGRRSFTPAPGGGGWVPGTQGSMQLGPVINAWVDPASNPTRNIELKHEHGRARAALKVKTLDSCPPGSGLRGTCYRYDYAVQNFDFATAATEGTPPNLRVIGARGFDRVSVQRPAGSSILFAQDTHFADTDIDSGNNWTAAVTDDQVQWTSPSGNELNWGTLYRFTFITDAAPTASAQTLIELRAANPEPVVIPLQGTMTGPATFGGRIMVDSFGAN